MNENNNLENVNTNVQSQVPNTLDVNQVQPVVGAEFGTVNEQNIQTTPVVNPQVPNTGPTNLNQQPTLPNGQVTKKKSPILLILIIILAFALIGGGLFLFNDEGNKNGNNDTSSETDKPNNDENAGDNTTGGDVSGDENIATDWKSLTFSLNDVSYTLRTPYNNFVNNGWTIDISSQYPNGYILNPGDSVATTVDLNHNSFSDADIQVGFINIDEVAKDITETYIRSIDVDNSFSDTPVNFVLAGGIKNGSTLAEVENAYGKPEADNIYRSEELKYYSYTYRMDELTFRLTIYDERGVVAFSYTDYS